ncbi:hypothetical protein L6470_00205 [Prevotella communis]|uniref:MBG domain-containing protein n=1 Tax=Prevotella communis TaxID=2913614 RepID=UPI001EDAFE27|nr:MBG domain-containing protein [Prevotella communis]UKK59469.1 hypothetical protein L6470_00205 [Prevotella communis]
MKKKIFSLLVLLMVAVTGAWADIIPTYDLTVGTNDHSTMKFYVGQDEVTKAKEGETVTIVVTPDDGWSIGNVTGQWIAAMAKAPRRTAGIGLLQDVDVTFVSEDAQTGAHTYTFVMQRAKAEFSVAYKKLLSHQSITITVPDVTYSGQAQQPDISVKDGDKNLVQGRDFAVTFSNNTNAGTGIATFRGVGTDYAGEKKVEFKVNKANGSVLFSPSECKKTFGDANFILKPNIKGDGVLTFKSDKPEIAAVDAATGEVTIKSTGKVTIRANMAESDNYFGSTDWCELIIAPKAMANGMFAEISTPVYTGEALVPTVVMKDGETVMKANTDYTLAFEDNLNAGTAKVTATGVGNYQGTATATFTIGQAALTAVTLAKTSLVYNQQEQTAQVTSVNAGNVEVPADGYEVTGNKGTNVGTYTATITGKGNFKGSVTAQFNIVADAEAVFDMTLDPTEYVYDGTEKKPTVTVKDGSAVLVEGTDYTLTYANNINAGTAKVTATGKGNYACTKTVEYTIKKADVTMTAPEAKANLVYNAQAQALVAAGTVQGGEMQYASDGENFSTTLPTGTDAKEYTVSYKVVGDQNHNDVAPQTIKVTIAQAALTAATLKETNLVYNQQDQTALVASVSAGTLTVPEGSYEVTGNKGTNVGTYTATITGKGNFKGSVTAQFSIVADNSVLFDLTLNPTEYVYDGTAKTPTVTVKDGSAVLVEGTDYTLAYTNNVNAGTAKVTATGKGNYTCTKTAEFTIKKAPLTIKVDDAQVICGKEAPQYEVSYEGFVAEETKDVLEGTLTITCDYTKESPAGSTYDITPSGLTAKNYDITFVDGTLTVVVDQNAPYKETLQTAIAIASNINPEALADAIAAAQAAMTAEDATAESLTQANQTLETAIKAYFGEILPGLGAIVEGLNDETLNAAYADAEAALAKEDVTLQELVAAMQQIIAAAQAVAPEHLQNLKEYAVKYGADDAATLIDAALEAIESGNVSQIIATMTAVKEAATPLAEQVLGTMINYVQAFGLTEQAAQAQAALESGNYITMITTAKELFSHLIAAAKEYLPKLGAIAEGLNDETLNSAYAAAQALLAKESITPEELGTAMQNIIAAAKAVAPEHLQNLKEYAVKYGAEDAATLIDAALEAIESGNVSQIIATMTAVKEAATPLAEQVLGTMINYVQAFGLTEQAAQAQAALESGNYITMITTAKELFSHLIAAAKEYLPKLGAIAEGLNDETLNSAYAAAQALLAKESITPEELGTAMQQIIAAAQAVAPEHLQNLKEYAVKYGADDAATLIDAALEAIESGNVSQIIATMTAVKEAATPLAEQVLGTMINYVQAFGLTEQAAQAQAALESGNYITMITTAKELFSHLIAAAKEYLPKLGAIAEGLNDETLNSAYAAAQALLAKESITPEELGTAMQQIIAAAKAVAPEHLQNLKEYAVKYGAEDAATLIDAALEAIESGNVSQIIATMTAVKEAATPLATAILTQMIEKAQSYTGFEEDITEAQAALESGNYITMITAAKAMYAKLQAVVTGVGSMKAAFEKDVWYDLNGHKLNGKPTKKGVYFINGKKVVMK